MFNVVTYYIIFSGTWISIGPVNEPIYSMFTDSKSISIGTNCVPEEFIKAQTLAKVGSLEIQGYLPILVQ